MTRPEKGSKRPVTAVVAGDRSFLVKGTGPFARAKARRIARELARQGVTSRVQRGVLEITS